MSRAPLRLVALWVLVATFGGQLAELVHRVVVAHEVCAEHGAVVHGDEHAESAAPRTAEHAVVDAAEDGHGEHEHCTSACVTLSPDATSSARPPTVLAPRMGAGPAAAPRLADVPASVPLLLAAPKTSPPSRC